jgi:putative colanic acid biosynthesis UDP-glucose lipid carrier transferase
MYDPKLDFRFIFVANAGWLVLSYVVDLYHVYRFTRLVRIIRDLINQVVLFFLLFSSLFAWSYLLLSKEGIFIFFIVLAISLLVFRIILYYSLRNYRLYGGNYRRVIIAGYGENSKLLYQFFSKRKEFGYKFKGFFSDKIENKKIVKGKISDIEKYVLENKIDEMYCNIEELNTEEIKRLITFADNNLKVIKFIPDSKGIYGNNELKLQYYDYLPILVLRENPFDL